MTFNPKDYPHHLDFRIRFMDLDLLGHVNNARYLNFLEEARIDYSRHSLGESSNTTIINVVVARIEIDYIRPIFAADRLKIYTRIIKIGSKSVVFESILTISKANNSEEKIAAKSIQTLVSFDPKSKKSTEISEDFKEKIYKYEGKVI